ncbi:hypothetical protein ALC62_04621 [Cyphomyrmex costatus]|uniref:Phospholipase A2-like domain-containing protein n=1 Tax=Cyphomyrmex costatus TaxID=456900 RepID=A0A151IK30_9HYME|nr:hypothetical protein ALC62_04621 [Cyphomyrmex costatus]
MYFTLYHRSSDIRELNAEQLQYIPKIVLLQVCGDYIDHVWDKLPEHVKTDSEVQRHSNAHRRSAASDKELRRMSTKSLLNRAINALPFELHIPGYQFCGPGTRLKKQLARGDAGVNPLDATCREHDITYSRSNDLTDRHAADEVLAEEARKRVTARDSALGGTGTRTVSRSVQIRTRAVSRSIQTRTGYEKKKKNVEETIKMPTGATTNVQLLQLAKRMRVPYFRGVFMRNALPKRKRYRESGRYDRLRYSLGSVREEEQSRRVL